VTVTLFVQCVVNSVVAAVALARIAPPQHNQQQQSSTETATANNGGDEQEGEKRGRRRRERWQGWATRGERVGYGVLAVAHAGAMASSNKAIFFVDYPTQVIAKCCKPIPVLLGGLLLGERRGKGRYPMGRVLSATLITAGVAAFMRASEGNGGNGHGRVGGVVAASSGRWWTGVGLLVVSLVLDGVAGQLQDALLAPKAREQHEHAQRSAAAAPWHMMFWVNLFSAGLMGGAAVVTGEGVRAARLCWRHPAAMWLVLATAAVSAVGQGFVFALVAHFDSLLCSIVTTGRKFASILLSVAWFGHSLRPAQWVAVLIVFLGVGFEIASSRRHLRLHHAAAGSSTTAAGGGVEMETMNRDVADREMRAAATVAAVSPAVLKMLAVDDDSNSDCDDGDEQRQQQSSKQTTTTATTTGRRRRTEAQMALKQQCKHGE